MGLGLAASALLSGAGASLGPAFGLGGLGAAGAGAAGAGGLGALFKSAAPAIGQTIGGLLGNMQFGYQEDDWGVQVNNPQARMMQMMMRSMEKGRNPLVITSGDTPGTGGNPLAGLGALFSQMAPQFNFGSR